MEAKQVQRNMLLFGVYPISSYWEIEVSDDRHRYRCFCDSVCEVRLTTSTAEQKKYFNTAKTVSAGKDDPAIDSA